MTGRVGVCAEVQMKKKQLEACSVGYGPGWWGGDLDVTDGTRVSVAEGRGRVHYPSRYQIHHPLVIAIIAVRGGRGHCWASNYAPAGTGTSASAATSASVPACASASASACASASASASACAFLVRGLAHTASIGRHGAQRRVFLHRSVARGHLMTKCLEEL